jgi:hypothetical protein
LFHRVDDAVGWMSEGSTQVVVAPVEKKDVPIVGHYIGVTKASLDVEVRARHR